MRLLFISIILISTQAIACFSSFNCGHREKCVGVVGFQPGVCVADEPEYNPYAGGNRPINVQVIPCRNNVECPMGKFCTKEPGRISGVCE